MHNIKLDIFFGGGVQAENEIWAEKGVPRFTTWEKNQIRFPKRYFLLRLFKDATRNLNI